MLKKIKDNQRGFNFVTLKQKGLLMPHPVLSYNPNLTVLMDCYWRWICGTKCGPFCTRPGPVCISAGAKAWPDY